tara:strand:+ start:164 stop:763 length:600 start_codon:yes stop_codon:yes gene_type:complete
MKASQIIIYLIYILLLSAIVFFSIVSISQESKFYTKKKLPIADNDLGRLLLEYSISEEDKPMDIQQRLNFYIVDIRINDKDSVEEVLKVYNEISENILDISKNFYLKKYVQAEKLFEIIKDKELENDRIENIERIVNLELFMQDSNRDYVKIKNKLSELPKVYSINQRNKYLPLLVFFLIILIIFHFSKTKIIRSIKKF